MQQIVFAETGVGAGTIVVIIVAVLIVFVAIVLTLLARSTGRWCFAGEYLAPSLSFSVLKWKWFRVFHGLTYNPKTNFKASDK
jgi:hypothetical protein